MVDPVAWRPAWLGTMRVRIVTVVVLLLLAASVGSVVLLRAALVERLEEEVAQKLAREVEEFRLLSRGSDPRSGEPFDGDVRAIFDVYFSREIPDEGESLLAFVDGRLYESRRAQDAADPENISGALRYWLSLGEVERGVIDTDVGEAHYVALPLTGGVEEGLFVVANFPEFERTEINDAVQLHVGIQILTLAAATALGTVLAGRILRPLVTLATTARKISETDLSRRIPVSGRDEASMIAEAFNDMLARLERAILTQRQFLDDTSHELRTPLTVIRGHLELLELDETPQERQETVALVLDEVDRLSRMVDDLFLLAQAQRPDFLKRQRLDLSGLVRDVYRKVTTLGDRSWQLDVRNDMEVVGDGQRLTQAIMQLVANAVRHTTAGDGVRLATSVLDGRAVLSVEDTGPGVDPRDAAGVFDRFRRGRTASSGTGAGMGLAIVLAIAEAHGGTARLVDRAGGGACFEIVLPLAPPKTTSRTGAGTDHAAPTDGVRRLRSLQDDDGGPERRRPRRA